MVVAQPAFVMLSTVASTPSIPGVPFVALRWLLDAGIPVAGSSDHPCAPMAPLDGIRSAVSRRTRAGSLHEKEQAVSLDEALTMYTRTAARVSFGAARGGARSTGTLEAGERADVVVLSEPLTAASLDRARVQGRRSSAERRRTEPPSSSVWPEGRARGARASRPWDEQARERPVVFLRRSLRSRNGEFPGRCETRRVNGVIVPA